MEEKMLDIESISSLSDDDLFKNLKKNGLKCGPITSTTRFLYEKRLREFIDPSLIEKPKENDQDDQQAVPEQKNEETPLNEEIETVSLSSEENKYEELVEKKVKSKVTVTPIRSQSHDEIDLNKSTDSIGSLSDNYLNISGIRGRAPLKRQNDLTTSPNSESKNCEKSKGGFLKSLVLGLVLAFVIYTVLTYVMDSEQNLTEF